MKRILFILLIVLSFNVFAETKTDTLGLYKPTVGEDTGLWGGYLNANSDTLDKTALTNRVNTFSETQTFSNTINGSIELSNVLGDTVTKTYVDSLDTVTTSLPITSITGDTITASEVNSALIALDTVTVIPDSYIKNYENDTLDGDLYVTGSISSASFIQQTNSIIINPKTWVAGGDGEFGLFGYETDNGLTYEHYSDTLDNQDGNIEYIIKVPKNFTGFCDITIRVLRTGTPDAFIATLYKTGSVADSELVSVDLTPTSNNVLEEKVLTIGEEYSAGTYLRLQIRSIVDAGVYAAVGKTEVCYYPKFLGY